MVKGFEVSQPPFSAESSNDLKQSIGCKSFKTFISFILLIKTYIHGCTSTYTCSAMRPFSKGLKTKTNKNTVPVKILYKKK